MVHFGRGKIEVDEKSGSIRNTAGPAGRPIPANTAAATATLELVAAWQREDATGDPEKIRLAELDLVEFKKAMNESRAASEEFVLYLEATSFSRLGPARSRHAFTT